MSIFQDFNANSIEAPKSDFELLPPGSYNVRVLEAEESTTRKGDPGIKLSFEVTDGDYMNRRLWERCWIKHSSEAFAGREQARFASLCRAVGVPQPQSTDEFLGLECVAKVIIEKSKNPDYADQNKCQDYYASTTSITPPASDASGDKPKRAGSGDWKTQ